MPGGFHPFHAGHMALYQAALEAFPSADVFVAATADTSSRPFPFAVKKFLAQQAGVPGNRFIQVKSPFQAQEITQMYDPDDTVLIFVRSQKDASKPPQPGGVKRDGSAAYLQPYKRNRLEPFSRHGYMAYLPTVQFGPGMTSATEIRAKWPEMSPEEKIGLVKDMYPSTAASDAAAGKIVAILDEIMGASMEEAMAGSQASLLGAPAGGGALPVKTIPMANDADDEKTGVRLGQEFDEATVVNDPESGLQIRPTGGLGTWTEADLRNNLVRKFTEMVNMLKVGDYRGLHHVLYQANVVNSMVTALAELQGFQAKQGNRPMAPGREINTTDYLEEKNQ